MTVLILISLLAATVCLVLVAPVLSWLLRPTALEEVTPEWLAQFSPSTYYPMQSLLAQDDFRFLARQPGFDDTLCRKLRRERMLIFRQYLRRLICDFNRLHTVARMLVANSPTDQSHMVPRLFSLKLRFTMSVLQAESSYFLCRIGSQALAARRVVTALEDMTRELQSLSAAPAAARISA